MKSGLLVLCLVLVPLAAQNNSEIKQLTVGPSISGLVTIPQVRFAAQSVQQNSGIVFLKGSVEINLGGYTLLADEAEYHQDTGEIQPRGNVRVKPTSSLDPRGVSHWS
jgi:lipopolysaccharide assembly outer membrane protein LptD (OstA)